jgi:hypothetical protein
MNKFEMIRQNQKSSGFLTIGQHEEKKGRGGSITQKYVETRQKVRPVTTAGRTASTLKKRNPHLLEDHIKSQFYKI